MRKIFNSFTARLTFYILTITFLIFLCIALAFCTYAKRTQEEQAKRYTAALQQNLIQTIDIRFDEIETALRMTEGQVANPGLNPDSVMNIVSWVLRNNELLSGVGIAYRHNYFPQKGELFFEYAFKKPDGTIATIHYGEGQIGDYYQRRWFATALEKKTCFWTDPYADYDNKIDNMTSFIYPCLDSNGEVYAVLDADVKLTTLTEDLKQLRPYDGSYSFIISSNGIYVSHPDTSKIVNTTIFEQAQTTGNYSLDSVGRKMISSEKGDAATEVDGQHVLLSYAPMQHTGWSVCSVNFYHDMMSSLDSTLFFFLAVLIIGLLLLSLCIRILVVHISNPIKQFADVSYQIARGNFNVSLPEVDTKDDLRKLHDAFAFMQKSLIDYIEELKTTMHAKERIQSELSIAHNIQMSLVPKSFSPFPDCDELELYACLNPAKEVGGDFYDFILRDGKLYFVIGDVSGKGVPASLVMAITRTLFRIVAANSDSPADIVSKLNNAIAENNDTNMFVTMYVGILNLKSGDMKYCNAGHNPPLIISTDGQVEFQQLEANLPLGVINNFDFRNQSTTLPSGSAVLLYTDGLTEAENPSKQLFGEQRLTEVASAASSQTAKEMIETINQKLTDFVGEAQQSDDLTIMCFRLNNTPSTGKTATATDKTVHSRTLTISNDLKESVRLHPFVEEISKATGIDEHTSSSINLALEEALVNSIQYAYPTDTKGEISLTAEWTDDRHDITFTLVDSGIPFNPLSVEEADTTLGVQERPIGGLGIFLVRQLMDEVNYQRTDKGENVLTMTKHLAL